MCCVFTCCGWMVDLLQRVWTFAMSCCISSAICCVLMSSSLSGIALGYNYSLAEYIDLKETNVSVYLKRGVFDDEIADDLEWRRAGHLPVAGHINDENLVTGGQDGEEPPLRSGRRLDDSVFDSNDQNKFEGSLMKLTAKPLDAPITDVTYTPDRAMGEILQNSNQNSLDRLKAIQGLLNMRRNNVVAATSETARRMLPASRTDYPEIPNMSPPASFPQPDLREIMSGRKFMPHDPNLYSLLNPARAAVPPREIGNSLQWKYPMMAKTGTPTLVMYNEVFPLKKLTPPGPVPLNLGPRRPPSVTSARRAFSGPPVVVFSGEKYVEKEKSKDELLSGDETDVLGQKMREDMSRHKSQDYAQKMDEDYEIDAKGLPVRKKRDMDIRSSLSTLLDKLSPSSEAVSTETVNQARETVHQVRETVLLEKVIKAILQ